MITGSSKEAADFPGNKQQKSNTNNNSINNVNKPSSSTSSSWLRLKDPRIVRVSRAFGGKDRHSKVCTVKGLRDRRVRLSVPTAIQLYDLQDRLGLSQPSKVVDWLLNAAKDEIDELPPLQMPVSFSRNQMAPQLLPNSQQPGAAIKIDQNVDNWDQEAARSNLWTSLDAHWRGKAAKEAEVATENENKQSSQFPKPSNSFLNINTTSHNSTPYGSLYQWEPNNSSFPSMSSQYGFMSQLEGVHHNMSSTLSLSSSGPTTQSYFPNSQMEMENYQRQINHFQMLSSGVNSSLNLLPTYSPALYQSMRPPFHFSMSSAASRPPVQPRSSGGNEQNKDQDQVPSK